jgi:hypothetical protein
MPSRIKSLLLIAFTMPMLGCFAETPAPVYVPDGTVVFSELHTPFGRIVERFVGHPYTHVAIVLDGQLYEAGLPVVRSKPYQNQGIKGGKYDYFYPLKPYSQVEIAGMRTYLNSQLGRPYRLATWINPRLPRQRGIYCSELVLGAINSSGRYTLPRATGYDPASLYQAIAPEHRYFYTQRK